MDTTYELPQALFVTVSGKITTAPTELGSREVCIRWENESFVIINCHNPMGATLDDPRNINLINALSATTRYRDALTSLYQAHVSVPNGMRLGRVAGRQNIYWSMTSGERAEVRRALKGHPLLDQVVSKASGTVGKTFGFFDESADPEKPGTPYLWFTRHNQVFGWVLEYVHMPNFSREESQASFVAWNDKAGLVELAERCKQADPEYVETVALLSGTGDSSNIEAATHELAAIMKAREAFRARATRVNVAVVTGVATRAAANASRALSQSPYALRPQVRQIFDLLPKAGVIQNDARAMNVGVVFSLGNWAPQDPNRDRAHEEFIKELSRFCAMDGLGEVCVLDSDQGPLFWVVKDRDLAQKHLVSLSVSPHGVLRSSNKQAAA